MDPDSGKSEFTTDRSKRDRDRGRVPAASFWLYFSGSGRNFLLPYMLISPQRSTRILVSSDKFLLMGGEAGCEVKREEGEGGREAIPGR